MRPCPTQSSAPAIGVFFKVAATGLVGGDRSFESLAAVVMYRLGGSLEACPHEGLELGELVVVGREQAAVRAQDVRVRELGRARTRGSRHLAIASSTAPRHQPREIQRSISVATPGAREGLGDDLGDKRGEQAPQALLFVGRRAEIQRVVGRQQPASVDRGGPPVTAATAGSCQPSSVVVAVIKSDERVRASASQTCCSACSAVCAPATPSSCICSRHQTRIDEPPSPCPTSSSRAAVRRAHSHVDAAATGDHAAVTRPVDPVGSKTRVSLICARGDRVIDQVGLDRGREHLPTQGSTA